MKIMFWLAMLAMLYVFFASFRADDSVLQTGPGLRVDLSDMPGGEARMLDWEGRPVLVYHRLKSEIEALHQQDQRLLDAASKRSKQPPAAEGPLRSVSPDWFVSIGLGTDLGCSLSLLPVNEALFQKKPWQGGFIDSCRKARYDLAGRVYRSQYADRNLVVPAYHWSGTTLILGR